MKKISIYIVTVVITAMFAACGGSKQIVNEPAPVQPGNPFGRTYKMPCAIYDTDTNFAATGSFKGSAEQKGEVHKGALANAQQLVRIKMSHAYMGMVSDFMTTHGINKGSDIATKMTTGGNQIVDVIVNNTSECCVEWSETDEKGFIECYVAIKIPKEEVAKKVASKVGNLLSEDEKLKIDFEEEQYGKQMEEKFKDYRGSH